MSRFYPLFILFIAFLSFLLPHIIYFVGRLVGKLWHKRLGYMPFLYVSLGLFACFIIILSYGYFVGRWKVEIKRVDLSFADLPAAFEGYRLVHISDLHLRSFEGHADKLQKTVDAINALKPDVICFTGDLVTFTPEEVSSFTTVLSQLRATDGVISVLGNHDCFPYSFHLSLNQKMTQMRHLSHLQQTLGWTVLNNENIEIMRDSSHIFILGIINQSCKLHYVSAVQMGDMTKAMHNTGGFRILMSHDPSQWEAEVINKTNIQLTLSGHTHNAQMAVGRWSPIQWFYDYSQGLYWCGRQALYVNAGLGCTAPFRIGVPQEITLITLHTR